MPLTPAQKQQNYRDRKNILKSTDADYIRSTKIIVRDPDTSLSDKIRMIQEIMENHDRLSGENNDFDTDE